MLSHLSPKTLRALEHDVEALRLRVAGHTFEEIAVALGYHSRGSAWKAVHRAKTARLLELARLLKRLELVDTRRQCAAIERRIAALNGGKASRRR
jgi:hypothetical protein